MMVAMAYARVSQKVEGLSYDHTSYEAFFALINSSQRDSFANLLRPPHYQLLKPLDINLILSSCF
jgi:hypothetical protein